MNVRETKEQPRMNNPGKKLATHDTWHKTHDTWHMTHDTRRRSTKQKTLNDGTLYIWLLKTTNKKTNTCLLMEVQK